MSELVKLNHITVYNRDNSVLKAYDSGEALKKCSDKEINESLDRFLSTAALAAGHKNTFTDEFVLKETIRGVSTYLKLKKPGLRLAEVNVAIRHGSYGIFGDYTHINVKQITQWIEAYDTEMRQPAMIRNPRAEESTRTKEEIEADNDRRSKEGIIKLYKESIQQGKNLFKGDNVNLAFFYYLERRKALNVSIPQKEKIFAEERSKAVKTARSRNPHDQSLKEYLEKGIGSFENKIKNACRERVLVEFIDECLEMEVDIEELL